VIAASSEVQRKPCSSPRPLLFLNPFLLHARTAALNQNDQHDYKQNARDHLNDRGIVHDIPLSFKSKNYQALRSCSQDADSKQKQRVNISVPASQRAMHRNRFNPDGPGREPILLNPGAAPLNQNDKHDDKQNAGDNLNDGGIVHEIPLSEFLVFLCFLLRTKTACKRRQEELERANWLAHTGTRREGSTLQQTNAPR